jgi:hypothetical protein
MPARQHERGVDVGPARRADHQVEALIGEVLADIDGGREHVVAYRQQGAGDVKRRSSGDQPSGHGLGHADRYRASTE